MESLDPTLEDFEAQFNQLETAMAEPVTAGVIENARTYNTLLSEEAVGSDDLVVIIEDLDQQWQSMMGQSVKVTGYVNMPNAEGEVEPEFCDKRVFISNGFGADNWDDEPTIGRKVQLQLLKPDEVQDDTQTYIYCSADIEQVSLEFSLASFERAVAWLTTFYPDLIDEIDARIFAPDGTEADAVMALKDLELPPFGEDEEFAHHCISNYLQAMIQFDSSVPYEIKIDGEAIMSDDGGKDVTVVILTEDTLMRVRTIVPGRRYDEEGTTGILSLRGSLVNSDRLLPDIDLAVPLQSVEKFESLRSNYYH